MLSYDNGTPVGEIDTEWWKVYEARPFAIPFCWRKIPPNWVCTLIPGHAGPHVAHGARGRVIARDAHPFQAALEVEAGL